jgi:hypothetical protein
MSLASSFALEEVSGLNLTADEGFGARHQGTALLRAGFQHGADAVVNAPASMNDVNDLTFSTAHAERFGVARFDCFALLVPWHRQGTFGLGVARYAVSDIPIHSAAPEDGLPSGEPEGWFTAADWLVAGSLSRRFGGLDLGGTLHLLYRKLDQSGLGMRADAMAQYTFSEMYRAGVFARGVAPSVARWESGRTEYEPSEATAFVAGRWEVPYFYGNLQAGLETAGLIQRGAKSADGLEGGRGLFHPGSLLKTSRVGGEFLFNFGLVLRAGLEGLEPGNAWSSLHLGTGYNWKNRVGIDYAFSAHEGLSASHRVALQFTPSFPRFEGRGFRPGEMGARPGSEIRREPGSGAPTPAPAGENAPLHEGKEILED